MVTLHSAKGKSIWKKICESGQVIVEKLDDNIALKSQGAIKKSAPMNSKRHMFFDALHKEEFEKLQKTWYKDNFLYRMKQKYVFVKTKIRFFLIKNK